MPSGNDHVRSIYKHELGNIKQIKMMIKRSSDLALTECVVSLTNWPFDHAVSRNKSKNEWFLNCRGPYVYVLQPRGLIRQVLRMKAHNNPALKLMVTICLLLYRIEVPEEVNQDLEKRWIKRLCWRLIPTFKAYGYYLTAGESYFGYSILTYPKPHNKCWLFAKFRHFKM